MLHPHEKDIGAKVVGIGNGGYTWTGKGTYWIIVRAEENGQHITLMPFPGTKSAGMIQFETMDEVKNYYRNTLFNRIDKGATDDPNRGIFEVNAKYFMFVEMTDLTSAISNRMLVNRMIKE